MLQEEKNSKWTYNNISQKDGFLQFLLPLLGALGAVGGVAASIANAVNDAKV